MESSAIEEVQDPRRKSTSQNQYEQVSKPIEVKVDDELLKKPSIQIDNFNL